jgi:hypothetical protein
MTDPLGPSDSPPPAESPNAPREAPLPIGTASAIGFGCAGFIGFFVVAGLIALGFASGAVVGVALLVVLVGAIVGGLRGAAPRTRAVMARVGVGFGIAAVVFGGCIAVIAQGNFH